MLHEVYASTRVALLHTMTKAILQLSDRELFLSEPVEDRKWHDMVEQPRILTKTCPVNETIVRSSFSSNGVPTSLYRQICPVLDIFRNLDLPRFPIFQSTTDGQLQDKQSASMMISYHLDINDCQYQTSTFELVGSGEIDSKVQNTLR